MHEKETIDMHDKKIGLMEHNWILMIKKSF